MDFINEGKNSERTKRDLEQIRSLKDKVYIPKVFWDYTSSRVLTCEWIDGVRVTDKEGLARQVLTYGSIYSNIKLLLIFF